jgi:hypothetical protein
MTKTWMMFPRLYISEPYCEQFLSAVRQYRKIWDEQRLDWKEEPYEDWTNHFSDMLRYATLVEDKMTHEEGEPWQDPRNPTEPLTLYG